MTFEDIQEQIKRLLNRKKIEEARNIVINAEVLSAETGIDARDILRRYIETTKQRKKKPNEYVEYIVKNIVSKKKSDVYKVVFDAQAIEIIKLGENSIGTATIIKSYYETMEIVNKGSSKIRGAMARPLIMYSLVSIIAFFILRMIVNKMGSVQGINTSTLEMIYHLYIPMVVAIGVAIAVPLVKYPDKMPKLKEAYLAINGYKYLSLVKFLFQIGISSQDIDAMFRKYFKEYKPKKKGMDGLVEFLEKYLDDAETAVFRYSVEVNKFEVTLNGIIRNKMYSFDKIIEQATAFLSETLILISVIPIVIVMFGVFSMMMSILNFATSIGAGG